MCVPSGRTGDVLSSLVPRPLPALLTLHAKKREVLVRNINKAGEWPRDEASSQE